MDIDHMDSLAILRLMNDEDQAVALAVQKVLPEISRAVEGIVDRLERRGRLFYVGAGTSGRLAVQDAVECPPTFGTDPELVQAIIAGGDKATHQAVEWVEDNPDEGQAELRRRRLSSSDAVVGIAASGKTPFTISALLLAQKTGAFTIGISCCERAELSRLVDVPIEVVVGPEVVTGSTRLKAGTAQKMVLNMLSTATMVRLGHVYSNLMVNVNLSNRKLIERGIRVIVDVAGVTWNKAQRTLREAGDVRSAIVMLRLDCTADEARGLVSQSARLNEILNNTNARNRKKRNTGPSTQEGLQ